MSTARSTERSVDLSSLVRRACTARNAQRLLFTVLGAAILTFGIHNIHQVTGITEGGVIGGMLLLNYWLGIPESMTTFALDALCYVLALRFLGWRFLVWSAVATSCTSAFYGLWERLPYMLPDLSAHPLVAAVAGGVFVGVGVGLVVRQGGSAGGDDSLALVISRVTGLRISHAYLFTDLTVLALSLSYIPLERIACSLVTVTISSYLIDAVCTYGKTGKSASKEKKRSSSKSGSADTGGGIGAGGVRSTA